MKHTKQEIVQQIFQQVENEETQKQEALQKVEKTSKTLTFIALFFFAIFGIMVMGTAAHLFFADITHQTVTLKQLSFAGKSILVALGSFIIGACFIDLESFIQRRNERNLC